MVSSLLQQNTNICRYFYVLNLLDLNRSNWTPAIPKVKFPCGDFIWFIQSQGHLGYQTTSNASECTVLLTDKIRRTAKFLCAMGRRIPIVSQRWLTASKKSKKFEGMENYNSGPESQFWSKLVSVKECMKVYIIFNQAKCSWSKQV